MKVADVKVEKDDVGGVKVADVKVEKDDVGEGGRREGGEG